MLNIQWYSSTNLSCYHAVGKWEQVRKQGDAMLDGGHFQETVQLMAAVSVKAVSHGQADPTPYVAPLSLVRR